MAIGVKTLNIDEILNSNPSKIARTSEEAENLRLKWLQRKEVYDKAEAKFVLSLKAEMLNLKSTEIKYYIANSEILYTERMEILKAESSYRKKELESKHLEEELRSAKMVARLQIAEITNLEGGLGWRGKTKQVVG